MRVRMIIIAPLLVAMITLMAACKSDNQGPGVASANGAGAPASASPTPSASADRQEQLRQFAQCMRDHGVDMADPDPNGSFGLGRPGGVNLNDPSLQGAFTACQSKLPNGGAPPKLNAQQLEKYQKFADCMRTNGVDLPDPGPDGTLQLGQGGPGSLLGDPDLQKALTACRDLLTALRSASPTAAAT